MGVFVDYFQVLRMLPKQLSNNQLRPINVYEACDRQLHYFENEEQFNWSKQSKK
jgi:hypothetical protein